MFYRYESNFLTLDPLSSGNSAFETVLKPSLFLRYDRAHAGASAGDVAQRSATKPTATGEADMEVTGPEKIGGGNSAPPTDALPTHNVTSAVPGVEMPQDNVNHSEAARQRKRLSDDPKTRAERLARIQAEIAAGEYDTDEKLEIAVERLLRENR